MTLKGISLLLILVTKCTSSSDEGNESDTVAVISNSTAMFISFGLTAIIMTIGFLIFKLSRKFCCCCIELNSVKLDSRTLESRELVAK